METYKRQLQQWLDENPKATIEEAWLAGYFTCSKNWCQQTR